MKGLYEFMNESVHDMDEKELDKWVSSLNNDSEFYNSSDDEKKEMAIDLINGDQYMVKAIIKYKGAKNKAGALKWLQKYLTK